MAYLTAAEFKLLTLAPAAKVEELPAGWLDQQLDHWSEHIDDRLRKRYATPFAAPVPRIVRMWLCQLVTPRVYLKVGLDATDEQFEAIKADAATADSQITAAADTRDGLYELPLRSDLPGSGVTRKGPKYFVQASPYAARDDWDDQAREDDRS